MSLELDARQRAMLGEMGVTVWWPKPAVAPAFPVAPAVVETPETIATNARGISASATSDAKNAPPVLAARPRMPTVAASLPPTWVAPTLAHSAIAQLDWPALQQAVSTCQACGLCQSRKNTVFGTGQAAATDGAPPQVDWLIVGDAPGEAEDTQGEPFAGEAGQLLDNMLKAMGQSRMRNVHITHIVKCRAPATRNPSAAEIAQCAPYLARQVALLQPKVIVALGRFAISALLADGHPDVHNAPLGKQRGQVYNYQGVPVVVSYHPQALLRNLPEKAKAWADLCLAMRVVRGDGSA